MRRQSGDFETVQDPVADAKRDQTIKWKRAQGSGSASRAPSSDRATGVRACYSHVLIPFSKVQEGNPRDALKSDLSNARC